MIGDGMGPTHLDAARYFSSGPEARPLAMEALEAVGQVATSNLDGITDSAAAATTMAAGVWTRNGRVGIDGDGRPAQTLIEDAQALGLGTGLVTTSSLPHATPGSFSAHRDSREQYLEIAEDQATSVRPDVMFGGGARYFVPQAQWWPSLDAAETSAIDAQWEQQQAQAAKNGEPLPSREEVEAQYLQEAENSITQTDHLRALQAAGYPLVTTSTELDAELDGATRALGLFALKHLPYVSDRPADPDAPTLAAMSMAAIEILERNDDGFFLVIEGARIDMASHENQLERAVHETLGFDAAVADVAQWAAARDDVLLIVTADHECGGLSVTSNDAGVMPNAAWRWGDHTNAHVPVFASGPGSDVFDGEVRTHQWVHAAAYAALHDTAVAEPRASAVVDGRMGDLRYLAAQQTLETDYGVGRNQADALYVDAGSQGLRVGVEGVFSFEHNAVVVLVDTDFGLATGPANLSTGTNDSDGQLDALLSTVQLSSPNIDGFGIDAAVVAWRGRDVRADYAEISDEVAFRGIGGGLGEPDNFFWAVAFHNFGEGVRGDVGMPVIPGHGVELLLPWEDLYPGLAKGQVPQGARVAVSALIVNDDGSHISNQALPTFPPGTSPGFAPVQLPGVVVFDVDTDADGLPDGDRAPTVVQAIP